MVRHLVFYYVEKIKFWVARAPRRTETPGYLIYEWLDGRPQWPLFARAICVNFESKRSLKLIYKIAIHEENRVTYMMATEGELDTVVERYPDAEILILNILR